MTLGQAGKAIEQILDGMLGIVDSLGFYIYALLIAIPAAIGSIVPVKGTAAGAALGQQINSILGLIVGILDGIVKAIGIVDNGKKLISLIVEKLEELDDYEDDELEDLRDLDWEDDEIEQAADAAVGILANVFPLVIGLVLGLLGPAARSAGVKIGKKLFGNSAGKTGGKRKTRKRLTPDPKKKSKRKKKQNQARLPRKEPGQFQAVIENKSPAAEAYELQVTGTKPGHSYVVLDKDGDPVKFDGWNGNAQELLEAKGLGYKKLFNDPKRRHQVGENIRMQAERQLQAAAQTGAPVRWIVAEKEAAQEIKKIFVANGYNIQVDHVPIDYRFISLFE